MTTTIVDRLEAIQIDQAEYVHDVPVTGGRKQFRQQTIKFQPVRQAGQMVVAGTMFNFLVLPALVRDIPKYHHHTTDKSIRAEYRCSRILDRILDTVPGNQECICGCADDRAFCQTARDRITGRGAVVLVYDAKDLIHWLADRFIATPACQ